MNATGQDLKVVNKWFLDECNRTGHKSCQQVVLDESVTLATVQKFCDLIEKGEAGENAN